jgi:hypothetical protein
MQGSGIISAICRDHSKSPDLPTAWHIEALGYTQRRNTEKSGGRSPHIDQAKERGRV